RQELQEISRIAFALSVPLSDPARGWGQARAEFRGALAPEGLDPKRLVLVGTKPRDAALADAADLARFLPAARYFAA
ncbi:MAG: hypothetical protein AAFV62_13025, partial [Pseudomonadota bacterium]